MEPFLEFPIFYILEYVMLFVVSVGTIVAQISNLWWLKRKARPQKTVVLQMWIWLFTAIFFSLYTGYSVLNIIFTEQSYNSLAVFWFGGFSYASVSVMSFSMTVMISERIWTLSRPFRFQHTLDIRITIVLIVLLSTSLMVGLYVSEQPELQYIKQISFYTSAPRYHGIAVIGVRLLLSALNVILLAYFFCQLRRHETRAKTKLSESWLIDVMTASSVLTEFVCTFTPLLVRGVFRIVSEDYASLTQLGTFACMGAELICTTIIHRRLIRRIAARRAVVVAMWATNMSGRSMKSA